MPRKINENIDRIRVNACSDVLWYSRAQIAPHSHMGAQRRRYLIRLLCRTIGIDLETCTVISCQQRLHKMLHDIAAKIRRDIADTNLLTAAGHRVRVARDIRKECIVCTVRTKQLIRVHNLCILCKQKRTVEPRIGRLLLIGTLIELCRPHIAHAIGDSSTQPHELMTKLAAPRCQIRLCHGHGARQIPLPLHGIGMKIAQHIILYACSKGALCAFLRFGIMLRCKGRKNTVFQRLYIHTHTIVTNGERL